MLGNFMKLLGGDLPSSFAYVVGEKLTLPFESFWSLHKGHKKSDRSPVSVFVCDKKTANPVALRLARNGNQKLKTIRHPNVLKILEGLEVDAGIYVVTEECMPALSTTLPNDPSWGIYQIMSSLHFINADCKLVHGALCPTSIFITPSGDWKLGSFELMGSAQLPLDRLADDLRNHDAWRAGWRPPVDNVSPRTPAQWLDRYGLGTVFCWSFAAAEGQSVSIGHADCFSNDRVLPPSLRGLVAELKRAGPDVMNIDDVLKNNVFFTSNPVIDVMQFLENINLKSQYDKQAFFEQLPAVIDKLPADLQANQLLPELIKAAEFSNLAAVILASILKCGSLLSTEDYRQKVLPTLTKLFNSTDRAVRYALLTNMDKLDAHLDSKAMETLLEPTAMGFSDSSAPLREATAKTMMFFIPKLKRRDQIDKALRLLSRLLSDPEAAIRTNVVICFAKIAQWVPHDQALKVLGAAFSVGLRDPFTPCRQAALSAVSATVSADVFTVDDVACKVMPTICLRLVDPDGKVRKQAFDVMASLSKHVQTRMEHRDQGTEKSPAQLAAQRQQAQGEGGAAGMMGMVAKLGWAGALSTAGMFGRRESAAPEAANSGTAPAPGGGYAPPPVPPTAAARGPQSPPLQAGMGKPAVSPPPAPAAPASSGFGDDSSFHDARETADDGWGGGWGGDFEDLDGLSGRSNAAAAVPAPPARSSMNVRSGGGGMAPTQSPPPPSSSSSSSGTTKGMASPGGKGKGMQLKVKGAGGGAAKMGDDAFFEEFNLANLKEAGGLAKPQSASSLSGVAAGGRSGSAGGLAALGKAAAKAQPTTSYGSVPNSSSSLGEKKEQAATMGAKKIDAADLDGWDDGWDDWK